MAGGMDGRMAAGQAWSLNCVFKGEWWAWEGTRPCPFSVPLGLLLAIKGLDHAALAGTAGRILGA